MTRPTRKQTSQATPRDRGTLSRGLLLLRLINQLHPVRIGELAEASGLHKATVSRIVARLRQEGYVARVSESGSYVPTSKVHELSVGLSNTEWIFEVAAPELDRLTQKVQWPSDFAILQGRGMSILYSTRSTAPIEVDFILRPINVYNIPIYESDFGRALLAWASPKQREAIRVAIGRAQGVWADESEDIDKTLKDIRTRGYATRGARYRFLRANTIAVCVSLEGQSIAAFNLLCKRPMQESDMARLFLSDMQETAGRIAERLRFDGVRIVPS